MNTFRFTTIFEVFHSKAGFVNFLQSQKTKSLYFKNSLQNCYLLIFFKYFL